MKRHEEDFEKNSGLITFLHSPSSNNTNINGFWLAVKFPKYFQFIIIIMYIKSIVVDGFKSYGTRTEILGFDPEFNAITGLNGTGKSNILDSICFVLGISNLTHVSKLT